MGEKWRTRWQHWIGTLCVVLLDGREVDRMDGNTVAALAGSWIGTRCGGEVDGMDGNMVAALVGRVELDRDRNYCWIAPMRYWERCCGLF